MTKEQLIWICSGCLTGVESQAIQDEEHEIMDFVNEHTREEGMDDA